MPSSSDTPRYQRWLWIELIGFDVNEPDYGISRFCQNLGFIPQGITLLLSDPEFVHGHTADDSRLLRTTICSYGAHPCNEERMIQVWSAGQLKQLVRLLHEKGILVFFTHFDAPVDGTAAAFAEVCFVNREGRRLDFLCPYKRFKDGTYYRDLYLPRMAQVVRDYGFDGYHGGDGFAHPRIPIYEGDFSDDTVDQFLTWSGTRLPDFLSCSADGSTGAIAERARWIWKHRRALLINFQRERTIEFWNKAATLLHADGKQLYLNSCWTRDPFEALYRYGVDYTALAEGGVDGFFAETAAAAHEYGGDLPYREGGHDQWDPSRVLSRFATKLLLLRAAAPQKPILFMNGIKDTNEAWCGIRHAPTNVESEILLYTGVFHISPGKKLLPASTGPLCTLSDGLACHEWEWIRSRWDLGYSLQPQAILGLAVYWSPSYPARLVKDYTETRQVPFDRIVWKLMVHGAPILATLSADALDSWQGPLLVVHAHLLPEDEWEALQKYRGGPLLVVGPRREAKVKPFAQLAASVNENALEINLYHWAGELPPPPLLPVAPVPFAIDQAEDPFQWLDELPSAPVDEAFYHYAADCAVTISRGIRVLGNRDDVRAWGYLIAPDHLRIHVRNDGFYYRTAELDTGVSLKEIRTLTNFPGNPVSPIGSRFCFKIAGKSMSIFEASLAALF